MFRIRQIHDDLLSVNKQAIGQVQEILKSHFSALPPEEIASLPEKLRNPFKEQFRSMLLVAERQPGNVAGFGLLMHDPELKFCFLDFIAAAREMTGRGIGGALYDRVRGEAARLGAEGMFFECLPDDPEVCPEPAVLKENIGRLRFYERFGVHPIAGTAYQKPIRLDERCLPYLMYDDLGRNAPLRREFARRVVRAILERKYARWCPPEYVQEVVDSFRDDPLQMRPARYSRRSASPPPLGTHWQQNTIPLVYNEQHSIHHVKDRGYVEAPVRIKSILAEIEPTRLFEVVPPRSYPERFIRAVHDGDFVTYLRRACAGVPADKSVYPYVFPIRNNKRPPRELSVRAGYYCIDTFTPLNGNAYLAARRAVDCTLTAADEILQGRRLAYALVRPPGHHAERRAYGGFCYFNQAAVAAQHFSAYGRVAILDVDYHHGNGQQEIFYERADVFTLSIHGHPNFAYPYFSGFADERGARPGLGYNVNLPLPETITAVDYREALDKALKIVAQFHPDFLIVALGLDTAKGDPTGTWPLGGADFEWNGQRIGSLNVPTLVVQEGGYRTRALGVNARRFFQGLFREVFP